MSSRTNAISQSLKATPGMALEHSELRLTDDHDEPTFTRLPGVVSARGSHGIKDWMAKEGIRGLVLAGLSSSGCVLSTAKDAADKGYIVTIVEDCCADRDPEVHELIMTKLLVLQCHVVSLESWEDSWSRDAALGRVSVRK
jgi:nicotinamidase-related amidase